MLGDRPETAPGLARHLFLRPAGRFVSISCALGTSWAERLDYREQVGYT